MAKCNQPAAAVRAVLVPAPDRVRQFSICQMARATSRARENGCFAYLSAPTRARVAAQLLTEKRGPRAALRSPGSAASRLRYEAVKQAALMPISCSQRARIFSVIITVRACCSSSEWSVFDGNPVRPVPACSARVPTWSRHSGLAKGSGTRRSGKKRGCVSRGGRIALSVVCCLVGGASLTTELP